MSNDQPQTSPDDPLEALGDRVRAAQETAERLVREATEAAEQAAGGANPGERGDRPPPRGYAGPRREGERAAEAQALAALLDLARTLVPAELRQQVLELVRELLLLVRAIIDWYLERLERGRKRPAEVEDIPIS